MFLQDYCTTRPDGYPTGYLQWVGEDVPAWKVLKECQGDCDRDDDCEDDLKCFQRRKGFWPFPDNRQEEVPGCIGLGLAGKDYCYDPSNV